MYIVHANIDIYMDSRIKARQRSVARQDCTVARQIRPTPPVLKSREYGNPIHSQNDIHSQNASYCHFESLIFKITILKSNLNKSPY